MASVHASSEKRSVRSRLRPRRLAFAALLIAICTIPGEASDLARQLITDAFTAVSSFVAAALFLFYGLERVLGIDIPAKLRKARHLQVPFAALLGATPGCGGAVIVVAAYASRKVSFGAMVAALTATMGDAAFLLIATRPDAALVVVPLSLGVGIAAGWLTDRLAGADVSPACPSDEQSPPRIRKVRLRDIAVLALTFVGLVIGIMELASVPAEAVFGSVAVQAVALAGTAACLLVWTTSPLKALTHTQDSPVTRTAEETSFITVWVVGAFLAYDFLVAFAGLDLGEWFGTVAPVLPLVGVVVGLVPGCGPQVLATTLYLNGIAPFSALVGNAISNDGDALFPAIALKPKAAAKATLYTAIPALVVAYGFYFLAPNFMN